MSLIFMSASHVPPAWAEVRLPYLATPIDYQIFLDVDPDQSFFNGKTSIRIRLHEKTQTLRMHALGLSIRKVRLDLPGIEVSWKQSSPPINEGEGQAIFSQPIDPKTLPDGFVTLHFEYTAPFNSQLTGLYRVTQGKTNYVFSQMQPYSARRVFPCFDEPRFKTPFDVSIRAPKDATVIANAPLSHVNASVNGKSVWVFQTTEPLATYLTAFMVGPFEYVEDTKHRLRIATTIGKKSDTTEALQATPRIMRELETYTGIPYPYQKLDVLAVPDFEAGAMENPGAITFRDYYVLLNGMRATLDQRHRFVEVMAHELAHQWFGNLVTPRWWNDLWLNESFATWLGSKITHALYPAYHEDAAAITHIHRAMDADALPTARRIREPIQSYQEIHNAFDAITYLKGGAILSMFEAWMGEESLRKANQFYLKAHAHNNAEAADWITSVSKYAGKDLTGALDSFLNQRGVPEVTFDLKCQPVPEIEIRQQRFTPLGVAKSKNDSPLWRIPVCWVYPNKKKRAEQCEVLSLPIEKFKLDSTKSCPAWVMPNKHGAGYFRFVTSFENTRQLFSSAWPMLTTRERLSVLDSFASGLSTGTTTRATFLEATAPMSLTQERRLTLRWMREVSWMIDHLALPIHAVIDRVSSAEKSVMARYMKKREPADAALLTDLRQFLIYPLRETTILRRESKFTTAILADLQDGKLDEPQFTKMSTDDIGISVLAGMQVSPDTTVAGVQKTLAGLSDGLLRQRLIQALATHPKAGAIRALLDWSLKANLRVNERPVLLEHAADKLTHRLDVWNWLRAHYPDLSTRLSPMDLSELPWHFTAICDEAFVETLENFFKPMTVRTPGLQRHLQGALAELRRCSAKRKFLSAAMQ